MTTTATTTPPPRPASARRRSLRIAVVLLAAAFAVLAVSAVLPAPALAAPAVRGADLAHDGWPWIEVNLSEQWLTAYEGYTPVFGAAVSTGVHPYYTPEGEFTIVWKQEWETMVGSDYYLPDVPYVMYFADYLAIHGTYWHDNFGYPMSHGCVNLPIWAAEWLYYWAPYGTPVWIHY